METYQSLATTCDSIQTYEITLAGTPPYDTTQVNLCGPGEFDSGLRTYFVTRDTAISEDRFTLDGQYRIAVFVITVRDGALTGTTEDDMCGASSYTTEQRTYFITQDTTFTETYPTSEDCDSIQTFTVTVQSVVFGESSADICSPGNYITDQRSYFITQDTVIEETYFSVDGCDSLHTLTVALTAAVTGSSTDEICRPGNYLTEQRSYFITQDTVIEETYFSVDGCDSLHTVTVNLTAAVTGNSTDEICRPGNYLTEQRSYFITQDTVIEETYPSVGGCDSLHTLTVALTAAVTGSSTDEICRPGNYLTDQRSYFITQDTVIEETYPSVGGCDSLHTLTVALTAAVTGSSTDEICSPGNYLTDQRSYFITQDTVIEETYFSIDGCDSLHTVTVNLTAAVTGNSTDEICGPGNYLTDQRSYFITQDTVIEETYPSVGGCDSLHTLTVALTPAVTGNSTDEICRPGNYLTDQRSYFITQDTVIEETYPSVAGCDSLHTLTVALTAAVTGSSTDEICRPGNYLTDQRSYFITQDTVIEETYPSVGGCDSLHTLTVALTAAVTGSSTDEICSPGNYLTDQRSYFITQDTVIEETYFSVDGCDSLHTVTVALTAAVTGSSTDEICGPGNYLTDQRSYFITQDTVIEETYPSVDGCDSLHTVTVALTAAVTGSSTDKICSPGNYLTDQRSYFITQDTVIEETYPSVDGCDSLHTVTVALTAAVTGSSTDEICGPGNYLTDQRSYFITQDTVIEETYPSVNGCDSLHTVTVALTAAVTGSSTDEICRPGTYLTEQRSYFITQDTVIEETYFSVDGCDSLHTVTVALTAAVTGSSTDEICRPGNYLTDQRSYFVTQDTVIEETYPSVDGCDSLHTVTVDLTAAVTGSSADEICSPGNYLTDQRSYFITQDTVIEETYPSVDGCDSLHTVTVDLTAAVTGSSTDEICSPGNYLTEQRSYFITQDTVIEETYFSIDGCDSLHTVTVNLTAAVTGNSTDEICSPGNYLTDQRSYFITQDTVIEETYPSVNGCDSLHTLTVALTAAVTGSSTDEICRPGNYLTEQRSYFITQDTVIEETYFSVDGCDSLHTVTVNLTAAVTGNSTDEICSPGNYLTDQRSYFITQDTVIEETYPSVGGCDSLHTLTVALTPAVTGNSTDEICRPGNYLTDQRSYFITQDTVIEETYPSVAGCDSLHTVTVALTAAVTGSSTDEICRPGIYLTDQRSYFITQDTVIEETYPSVNGCDSLHSVTVALTAVVTGSSTDEICGPGNYLTDQRSYFITQDTVIEETYFAVDGCDSLHTVTVALVDNPPVITDIEVRDVDCFNASSGAIRITGTGDFANAALTLSGRAITFNEWVTDLREADYALSVTYPDGCTEARTISVATDRQTVETIVPILNECGSATVPLATGDIRVFRDTTIRDSVTGPTGCTSVRIFEVSVLPTPDIAALTRVTDVTCAGVDDGTLAVFNDGSFFRLEVNGGVATADSLLTGLPAGEYLVSAYYCSHLAELSEDVAVTIGEPQPLVASLSAAPRVLSGDTIRLAVEASGGTGGYTYEYSLIDSNRIVGCQTCPAVEFAPDATTLVTTIVTDENACVASDTTAVAVVQQRRAYLPTAFSPNGDGTNDRLRVYGRGGSGLVEEMSVYDRWGAMIFRQRDVDLRGATAGWDGEGYPAGAYAVHYRILWPDGVRTSGAGAVQLLR